MPEAAREGFGHTFDNADEFNASMNLLVWFAHRNRTEATAQLRAWKPEWREWLREAVVANQQDLRDAVNRQLLLGGSDYAWALENTVSLLDSIPNAPAPKRKR